MANLSKSGTRTNVDPWREFLNLESFFDRGLSSRSALPAVLMESKKTFNNQQSIFNAHLIEK